MPFAYEDYGSQLLKEFEKPTRAFSVTLKLGELVPSPEFPSLSTHELDRTNGEDDQSSLEIPEEPSIAVLPFTNMSGDPDQEFFADGLSEDIITGLSSVRGLLVIARGSTFVYKGRNVAAKSVARDLGVRFILEGSVRRSADRCRVSVELIEAETGRTVWTQKYDRELTELFELHDIMESVVASVTTQVIIKLGRQGRREGRTDIRLWDLVSQASSLLYDFTPESLRKALELSEKALSLYPDSDKANIAVASTLVKRLSSVLHLVIMDIGYDEYRETSLKRARELAERALELESGAGLRVGRPYEEDEWSHLILAWILQEFSSQLVRHLRCAS